MSTMSGTVVLRGGSVVDGTGAPARRADVVCKEGRILAVGEGLAGELTLDCGGLTVAPGFIDTHSHSDLKLFEDPNLPMKVAQGITLEVLGQDGISVAPVREDDVPAARQQLAGLLGNPSAAPWSWRRVADYLGALAALRPAPNVAYLVPHGTLRAFVMGAEARPPSEEERAAMMIELDRGLREGALGLSTGLIYPPCCYAEREELVSLGRVCARHRAPIVVHMRSESDHILAAIDEMLDVGRTSGCAVHISHWKIAGRSNFGAAHAMMDKVRAARAEGLQVTCDQYPYAAGSTLFSAILPLWVHDGGPRAAVARLGDSDARARIRAELLAPPPQSWDNFWGWTGPEGIVLSDVPSGRRPELSGKTVAQAAGGADPIDFALDLLHDEELKVGMISHSQSDAVVDQLLLEPYVNICTDGLLGGRPHPRAYGSFPRVLARYVRDRGVLTLEEAVRRMTSQAASAMNLTGVGQVVPGMAADLVAFDPATVQDRATFAEPAQLPHGIVHVLSSGRPVSDRAGRVVKR
jgi:N-acyl-D-amino-acid deacylase